ncbi:MAG: hypothetical protein LBH37_00090 [Oscillospiraceae bacterium]|nr:hypothetical protein [Oscillospiraceae bacterium]
MTIPRLNTPTLSLSDNSQLNIRGVSDIFNNESPSTNGRAIQDKTFTIKDQAKAIVRAFSDNSGIGGIPGSSENCSIDTYRVPRS